MRCLQPPFTILETTAKRATAAVAVDKGTKSAIAGKQSVSFGQTTATGGLLQSSPCARPSKLMRLQEKKKKKKQAPHRRGSNRDSSVPAAWCVSLWACSASPVPTTTALFNPPVQPFCLVGLQCNNSLHTRLQQREEMGWEKDQLGWEQQLFFFVKQGLDSSFPKQLQELKWDKCHSSLRSIDAAYLLRQPGQTVCPRSWAPSWNRIRGSSLAVGKGFD